MNVALSAEDWFETNTLRGIEATEFVSDGLGDVVEIVETVSITFKHVQNEVRICELCGS